MAKDRDKGPELRGGKKSVVPNQVIHKPSSRLDAPLERFGLSIFSGYRRSRIPKRVQSWDSVMYHIGPTRNFLLGRTGYGAAWSDQAARGYNSTPTSMTGLDYVVMRVIRHIADKAEKDQWVDAQEVALVDKWIGDALLILILGTQIDLKEKLPSSLESDTLGSSPPEIKWTYDTMRSRINQVLSYGYRVYDISVKIARMLAVFWRYEVKYEDRSMPGGLFYPWLCTAITVEMFDQLFLSLRKDTPLAELHAKRIKMPWREITESDLNIYHEIPRDSDFCRFIRLGMPMSYKDSTTAGQVAHTYACNTPSNIDMFAKEGEVPLDIWALAELLWLWNNGSDNTLCILGLTACATASRIAIRNSSYNSVTAPAIILDSTYISFVESEFPALRRATAISLTAGGSAITDTLTDEETMLNEMGRDYHWCEGKLTFQIMEDALITFLVKMYKGEQITGLV